MMASSRPQGFGWRPRTRFLFVLGLALVACVFSPMAAPAPDPYAPEANSEPFPEEAAPAPAPEAAPAPTDEPVPAPAEPAAPAEASAPEAPAPEEAFPGWDQIRDRTGKALEASGAEAGPEAESVSTAAEAPAGWKTALNSVSALFFVLALIVGCYVLLLRLRRHAPMLGGGELAQPLGRLHLDPRYALHFVRVGERVLVLGVTAQNVSLLETLDAAAFDRSGAASETETPQDFLAHLRASGEALNPLAVGAEDDEEIASLRGDIERLKRYLEEGPPRDSESK